MQRLRTERNDKRYFLLDYFCFQAASFSVIETLKYFIIFLLLLLFKFYFIFKLYIIVLVLPNIKMNPLGLLFLGKVGSLSAGSAAGKMLNLALPANEMMYREVEHLQVGLNVSFMRASM